MKKNVGKTDSLVRFLVAAVIAVLYFTGQITGVAAVVLGILALVFILTGFINFCPIWWALGVNTRKKEEQKG
ncbi:MAG TPA: DUF2892 domain-containing protein [Flavobacteriales bacterium]|nr:DUF2892 domain-containing protein [Flavobacteriales bacterium]